MAWFRADTDHDLGAIHGELGDGHRDRPDGAKPFRLTGDSRPALPIGWLELE